MLVAMSGGVDSSVAAALLVAKGYEVAGAYMLNYDEKLPDGESCWLPDYRDALRVAARLGIQLLKFDFTKEYKAKVLDYMFKEYGVGRTPNPDVLCNKFIKFGVWLEKAKELGFEYLATGHYATLDKDKDGVIQLVEAVDKNKDQTYFLHQLNQEQLARTMFPIGDYTKEQARKLAKKFNLATAEKEESMGICFIGEVPMDEFLKTRIKPKPGNIIFSDGTKVGEHEGLPFYTIGQRHINVYVRQATGPLFVVAKNSKKNELVVGYVDDPLLYSKKCEVREINWVKGSLPKFPLQCEVRLRHRQPLRTCKVINKDGSIFVEFNKPERAVTPGQFAVFYLYRGGTASKKGICLGGGVIY